MKTPQLPVPNLSQELGLSNEIWFKYENKHHFGSHKGRSIPLMIDEYRKSGVSSFVISSSGNAALTALRMVLSHNKNKPGNPLSLHIFVGQNIDARKLSMLQQETGNNERITIEQVTNPKQSALQFEKTTGAKWLRTSTDPLALVGYHALAEELARIEGLAAVFIPTSSGTTAEGLYEGFEQLQLHPQIHIIQTDMCHPIASLVDSKKNKPMPSKGTEPSLAGAIVDLVGLRKEKVAAGILASGGDAWVASNEQIKNAIALVQKSTGVTLSTNSALSVVGLLQAIKQGLTWKGPVVCLITGD